jgi:hypothetical protein
MSDDVDRIIAAHRDEARRTRTLLVWLFIGIPLAVGLIWFIVWLAIFRSSNSAHASTVIAPTVNSRCNYYNGQPDPYDAYCSNAPTLPRAPVQNYASPPSTPSPNMPAINSFIVTDDTSCSTLSDWFSVNGTTGKPINPKDDPIYGGYLVAQGDPVADWLGAKGLNPSNGNGQESTNQDEAKLENECKAHNGDTALTSGPDESVLAALHTEKP